MSPVDWKEALTPSQHGKLDEIGADPVQMLDNGAVVVKVEGTGELRQIGPRGGDEPFTGELTNPEPALELDAGALAAEIIEGSAEEDVEPPAGADVEGADESKPSEADLAVDSRGSAELVRHEAVKAMDRADEVLILDEIQGRTLRTFVYSFEQSGQILTDLTVAGVNEVIRLMNERGGCQIGISEQPPIIEEITEDGKEKVRVQVYAFDARRPGTGRWGVATEPKKMRLKGGGEVYDKFAVTKALNKAQRNALKMQIPEEFRQTIIATFLNEPKAVKVLEPVGAGAVGALPPPADSAEAKQLLKEIEETRDEIYKHDRVSVLNPAKYNAWLTQAQHDESRLRDLLEHLKQILAGFENAEEEAS